MIKYVAEALKTESNIGGITGRTIRQKRLLHAAMGLCTETSEFMDMLKKHIYYDKKFDRLNAIEELGDIFWYLAIAADVLSVTFEEIQHANIEKLRKRYPEKFCKEKAVQRNTAEEIKAIEQAIK
jgi:NTP pyrophosphatase (non-canonical NTP hydrolase)